VVSAMAIDCGVCLIFAPAVGTTVSVTSANFNGRVEFDLTAVPARGEAGDGERSWGRYVAGAAFALQSRGYKYEYIVYCMYDTTYNTWKSLYYTSCSIFHCLRGKWHLYIILYIRDHYTII
jgi:hypothetical protein